MTEKEKDEFHADCYGSESITIDKEELIELLQGGYICSGVCCDEYSVDIKLEGIDSSICNDIIKMLK